MNEPILTHSSNLLKVIFPTIIIILLIPPTSPTSNNSPIYHIKENQPSNTFIGNLKADLNLPNVSLFYLLPTNLTYFTIDGLFNVHPTTGILSTRCVIDLESESFLSYKRLGFSHFIGTFML